MTGVREKILELLRASDGYVSGQEIGERLGVSRTSIWKAVRQLTEMGYEIEAVRNRGYRLRAEPDLVTEESVSAQLITEWAGRPVLVFDSLDSTNNEVKRRAEEGAGQGLLVIADEQTAGRGRRGRTWESGRGEGIFMSLLLRPDIEPGNASMLTLVMGMAVRDALEDACVSSDPDLPDISIKWPNDIVMDGKKVCGILTEMSSEMDCVNYVVIGVGINVNTPGFSGEVAQTATSVWLQTGIRTGRAGLIAACMKNFEIYFKEFLKTQDMSALMDIYNAHLINRGRKVCILDDSRDCTGTGRGIDERGELIVDTPDGERRVSAGEVSVRGVYGYI